MYRLLIFKIYYKGKIELNKCICNLFFELLCLFEFCFRQYFELENLRKRHVEELKSCMQMLRSESLQPTILYEALSPLSNSSKYTF